MLVYKIIGLAMILLSLTCSIVGWLREYLRDKEKRRRRRLLRKRRSAYKEGFRKGTLRDIEKWRGEVKPDKHLNVICKNPEYAEAWL